MSRQLRARPGYRWYALTLLLLIYTSSHVDRQIMGILLQPIKQEFQASDTEMGFLIGLTFALFYATLGIPLAMIADRGNRRNLIVVCVSVWSAMTAACGLATSFIQLALCRIGVGVGEAGSTPPSHSVIADLFPASGRATAMGIYATGANIGVLVSFLVGGWISQYYGWRLTFLIVGLPGLALSLLTALTLAEPERGASDGIRRHGDAPSLFAVVRLMYAIRSVRHVVLGGAVAVFVAYGLVLWLPAFYFRSHDLTQVQIGMTLAFLSGVIGGSGTFCFGKLADRLGSRDVSWTAWVVAIAKALSVPFLVLFFLADEFTAALALYVIPAFLGGAFLGPGFAIVQNLMPVRMRAVASAVALFVANIVGLGLGPQSVGILSDYLSCHFGDQGLRYSLLAFSCVNLWAAVHFCLAGRHLKHDMEAVALR